MTNTYKQIVSQKKNAGLGYQIAWNFQLNKKSKENKKNFTT